MLSLDEDDRPPNDIAVDPYLIIKHLMNGCPSSPRTNYVMFLDFIGVTSQKAKKITSV